MRRFEKELTQFISEEKTPNEDRLVLLCDGVFAIAMTLLIFGISLNVADKVPLVNKALPDLISPTISYALTFFIIAMYWRSHRTLMKVVQRLDNAFISLTFLFLAFIAFFPATSNLLGHYADVPAVVVIYTLGLSGCGFSALALWLYATWNHRLVAPDLPNDTINTRTYALLLNPLIFCASLLLLFVVPEPVYICFSWALIGFTYRFVQAVYKRWLEKPVQALIHRKHENPE
jgi:uncharacterized membrane protein